MYQVLPGAQSWEPGARLKPASKRLALFSNPIVEAWRGKANELSPALGQLGPGEEKAGG